MHFQIGTDLCDPTRIEKIYRRYGKKFVTRILTTAELEMLEYGFNQRSFKPSFSQRLAARYAAKEAVSKVLGCGIGKEISFQDIEIMRHADSKAPIIKLSEKASKLAEEQKLSNWQISISHEKSMSIAVVIASD
jgi:holo-[acyl-carrier protein] synthase